MADLGEELLNTARAVLVAVAPLVILFVVFQVVLLRLPRREVASVLAGTAVATLGLFLFLVGIGIGFLPFGKAIGAALHAADRTWLFVLVGALLGFFTAWGEPAVRVLASQVEQASNGSIRGDMVLHAICAAVALSVALGALRIVFGFSVLWLLVPGYILAAVLIWLSGRDFVAIAVDAGGVATGPLANSFLLALALGAAASTSAEEAMVQGFGLVALIALAPIISVMTLGAIVQFKTRRRINGDA